MRWLNHPVVHFVAIGAALFALTTFAFGSPRQRLASPPAEPSVISAARVEALRQDWLARTGRIPSAAELEALVEAEIDDQVLLLEARRLGLQKSDPLVQRRLLLNMSFLGDGESRSPAELLAEAFSLGMDESDLVVRRRLIQKMKLDIYAAARTPSPTDAELTRYLERHAERFAQPERVGLTHVFLSRDRRGAAVAADARAALSHLERESVGPERAGEFGDPFLFPRDLPPRSERELAKIFGEGFARQAIELPEGRWRGPIASACGLHLVWVREREPRRLSRLDEVRGAVREAVLSARAERALREAVYELRGRHPVRVEGVEG